MSTAGALASDAYVEEVLRRVREVKEKAAEYVKERKDRERRPDASRLVAVPRPDAK